MKNLILVIGRSGSGKDTLVRYATNALKDFHKIVSVPSYTDRLIRPTETGGVEHTLLTKEQVDELLEKETMFAYTISTNNCYISGVELGVQHANFGNIRLCQESSRILYQWY
jgi:guanylate kinase